MNKRQIIASLNKIANELDISGLYKEANNITNVMKRLANSFWPEPTDEDMLRWLREQIFHVAKIFNRNPKNDSGRDERELLSSINDRIKYWKERFQGDQSFFDQEAERYKQEALSSRTLYNRLINIKDKRFFSPLVFGEFWYDEMPISQVIDVQLKWIKSTAERTGATPEQTNEQIDLFQKKLLNDVITDLEENEKNAVINYIDRLR